MADVPFSKIEYHKKFNAKNKYYIEEFIGLDSEAYDTGEPFIICDSTGREYDLKNIIKELMDLDGERIHFALFNLRYDAGAILYFLPHSVKRELWLNNEVNFEGVIITYIPHKMLRFRRGKTFRTFWDIRPFYNSSLDAASKRYLNKSKQELETKTFSKSYVKKNRERIKKYNIHDSKLTAELGNLLLTYLHKFNIHTAVLYSTASVSLEHFMNKGIYIDVERYFKFNKPLLEFAHKSYYGGKFEITARGRFKGYEYDISSAYGSEIRNLKNIKYGIVHHSKKFLDDMDYGFIDCEIDNSEMKEVPTVLKKGGLNIYPAGKFRSVITSLEYQYLLKIGVKVKYFEGWFIKCSVTEYPYRKEIDRLYEIKEQYVNSDKMFSKLAKTMINALYGKFVQIIESVRCYDENHKEVKRSSKKRVVAYDQIYFKAGIGWNPIYASYITAAIRIKLCELQNSLGKHCLAVHTDAIITDQKMPDDFTGTGIGTWELAEQGEGVIVSTGIYQLGEKVATRGFVFRDGENWFDVLGKAGTKSHLKLKELRVLSWTQQIARGKDSDINLFSRSYKDLNLNGEMKRIWMKPTNAKRLLTELQYSSPMIAL